MRHLAPEGSGDVGDDFLRSSFYQSVGGARESPQRAPYCHLCLNRALMAREKALSVPFCHQRLNRALTET
jgi:hypothetical protein